MANVLLARCALPSGPAWGVLADDRIEIVATDAGTNGGFLASLLQLPRPVRSLLERRRGAQSLKAAEVMAAPSSGVAPHLLPPLDLQEVWAAGVTYERSRVARMEETAGAETFYDKVYSAERPELIFKGAASRVSGHNGPIRIRRDAAWNVTEPEIAVLVSAHGEIAGYGVAYEGKISTSSMRRSFADLVSWLVRDNLFPSGAYLLTGTGLVPEAGFTL